VLPPGLALFTSQPFGSPNFPTLAGQPTTPGTYAYTLRAIDSAAPFSSADHTFTFRVAPMQMVSPLVEFPNGVEFVTAQVGVPFSLALKMAGGTPPYTFTYELSALNLDMLPPGFNASASGLISGTTGSTGAFGFLVTVHDSAGNTYATRYALPVTNASGLEVITGPLFGGRLVGRRHSSWA
jgi:hypothetical protein